MGMGGLVETEAELEQSMREATQGDAENDKFFIRFLLRRLCRRRNCSKNIPDDQIYRSIHVWFHKFIL